MRRESSRVARALLAAAAAFVAGVPFASDTLTVDRDADAGRLIYSQGVLPSGAMLRGTAAGDVATEGAQLVCVGCHGRSGMGVGEGQTIVPPVAGSKLYRPREFRHRQSNDVRTLRPAYNDETLARVIRTGIDPSGRSLDAMMPRYALDDSDLSRLISYLRSLSSHPSPGVEATDIHFATIITSGVELRKRQAMLDVLEAFVASKSAETRHEASRAKHSPTPMDWHYQAYRKWKLHVWDLSGPEETWRDQLEQLYDRQPVFAVISGIGSGSWRPIHEFCEQRQVPCLLPHTELPVVSETDYYSVYFSKGIVLEAQVLAKHLSDKPAAPVVQVYRPRAGGATAAAAFREAMKQRGTTDVQDRILDDRVRVTPALWQSLQTKDRASRFVLWLDDADLVDIRSLSDSDGAAPRLYISSAMAGSTSPPLASKYSGEIYAVQLLDLPADSARRLRVLDVWMRGKGIPVADAPLQANTLFAATLAAQALKHIGSNFYRDYFIERIEHIFDSMVTPSAYPRPSLGPSQRYASKGGYILRMSSGSSGELTQRGEWIVP